MFFSLLCWCCVGRADLPGQDGETWRHDAYMGGMYYTSVIDRDGDMLAWFVGEQAFLVNKDRVAPLRPKGQGPGDLETVLAMIPTADGFAALDRFKVKFFTKKDGAYHYADRMFFMEPGKAFVDITGAVQVGEELFICGAGMGPGGYGTVTYVRAFDMKTGKATGDLVHEFIGKDVDFHLQLLRYFLKPSGDKLVYLRENSLDGQLIDPKTHKLQPFTLEHPPFHQPMPEMQYTFSEKDKRRKFEQVVIDWRTGYTALTNVATLPGYLVVQMRTMQPRLGTFALVFYDAADFRIRHIAYTADFLLNAHDGKLYFYEGGEPTMDEGVDGLAIRVRPLSAFLEADQ